MTLISSNPVTSPPPRTHIFFNLQHSIRLHFYASFLSCLVSLAYDAPVFKGIHCRILPTVCLKFAIVRFFFNVQPQNQSCKRNPPGIGSTKLFGQSPFLRQQFWSFPVFVSSSSSFTEPTKHSLPSGPPYFSAPAWTPNGFPSFYCLPGFYGWPDCGARFFLKPLDTSPSLSSPSLCCWGL